MEGPTSSTNGKKRKSPCESSNKESDETQETLNGALASEQSLKKTKKSQYPTILVFYYRKGKKICSNQMEKDQS
ncbi:sperm protein associated with the nucleus on the X chromosome N3-like [Callithrix jacchus]